MAEAPERHQHLRLTRAEPVNPRRTRLGFGGGGAPADPQRHGEALRDALDNTLERTVQEAGFDPRRLLKLEVDGLDPEALKVIEGLAVVSQEDKTIVVLFATHEGQQEFRRRLDLLSRGQAPTHKEVLFAIKGVSEWSPDDRIGPAIRAEGLPSETKFVVDVELWPMERRGPDRQPMRTAFAEWCNAAGAELIDQLDQDPIVLYRVEVTRPTYDRLLQHRDVRLVDLPPRYQLSAGDLELDLDGLQPIADAPKDGPVLAVLDSGVASNHPLLAPGMGDAQSFVPGLGAADEHGHGTAVAGLALYGDVAACAEAKSFVPRLRILSGRITDHTAEAKSKFVENHIAKAVAYFVEEYGCKVFNLSLGDRRKPYVGNHVRGLALTIDALSREYQILFVISAGNYEGGEPVYPSPRWKTDYPSYLLERASARILDPAPALNALTVGALARYDTPRPAQRFPTDVAFQPAARRDQPSPFSRSGPGPGGALKPDVVAYGGNYGVNLRDSAEGRLSNALLGEPAPAHDFASRGRLLSDFVGTSFAAPHVAHIAARLLGEYPDASANLLRALIVAHATVPRAAEALELKPEQLRRLVGYGQPQAERCIYSVEQCVSLIVEESIAENQHHFYELPLPEDFLSPARRDRAITVALAHTPLVRTTRVDYRGSRMAFKVVRRKTLDAVTRVFQHTKKAERAPNIPEFRTASLGSQTRDKGTVQAATYAVKKMDDDARSQKLFVVVTRTVPTWAGGWVPEEPYALTVVLEDRSQTQVRYYQQLEIQLRQRERARF